ncbi:hypothetical protein [Umezawaea sp. Da 62-37]|uniref:hypothetical protein n=1 Tax=Umezawaea sp. Da 62-37 TaxID=3075927 RepID=UPI0028F70185|nr:hypothetical protein [Umezawaea sp. Da 62-37]WNV84721.1 hypothetical protein RM788_42255 [Umezawaea sp. Da 62-37]
MTDFGSIMSAKEFAAAYGVGLPRLSQLNTQGVLPAAIAPAQKGPARWDRDVVFRFLAQQRRDEDRPGLRLPLLLPRAGVTWRLDRRRTITAVTGTTTNRDDTPVSVHVMTYRPDTAIAGHDAVVHLLTVLAPHSPAALSSWTSAVQEAAPVVELVLRQLHPDEFWADSDTDASMPTRAALVVLDTRARYDNLRPYDPYTARVFTTEVFPAEGIDSEQLSRISDIAVSDITATLGHDLPLWPLGHVTADLVAAWRPKADPVTVTVPPFAAREHKILRWTERAADGFGADADDVRELGADLWRTRIGSLREHADMAHRHTQSLPLGWTPAVRWNLAATDIDRGVRRNIMAGADAVLGSPATPRHVAQAIVSYLGDPAVFTPLALPVRQLPSELTQALEDSVSTEPIPAAGSWRLFALQQLLAEQGVDPDAVRGARWRTRPRRPEGRPEPHREPDVLFGQDVHDVTWVALHPPRDVPADLAIAEQIRDRGVQLWIAPDGGGNAAYLLLTDDGLLVPLPVSPVPATRSAWWLAHVALGVSLPYGPGGLFPQQHALVDLIGHATDTRAATMIPWSLVVDLVADTLPLPM